MKKYYFNWKELLKSSNRQNSSILILTAGLIVGYNYKIAVSTQGLMKLLNIPNIPPSLFQKGRLRLNRYHNVICKFKCEEPQSYFINKNFLYYKCHASYKVNYLYALSLRNIAITEPRIPKEYLEESKWENPLLEIDGEYINFLPEIWLQNGGNK